MSAPCLECGECPCYEHKRETVPKAWIGVDFDGTLVTYGSGQWPDIGEPIEPMVNRVKAWMAEGRRVKIMTARAAEFDQVVAVRNWTRKHLGRVLEVTDRKDYEMIELWDDRAIGVIKNTGVRADGQD